MEKLCQCKQDTLRALVLGTATGAAEYEDEDDLDDFAYEQLNAIVKLLESDCVCEKKETVTKSDQLKGTSHGVVRDEKGEIIAQCRCFSHEKEEPKPECDLHFYKTEDGYCMKGCGYKFPDGYSPEGMQPECDHIVGYRNESDEVPDGDDYFYYDHDIIVHLSELETKADIVVCSKCGERLRRVKVTYLDDTSSDGHIVNL